MGGDQPDSALHDPGDAPPADFVDRVNADLANLGSIGGPETQEVVARLIRALEPTLTARFLEAVTDLADECAASGGPHLDVSIQDSSVRLRGRDASESSQLPATGDLTSRFALRVAEDMKRDVEQRAGDEGISINSWIVRAIDRALVPVKRPPDPPGHRGPKRMRGAGRA